VRGARVRAAGHGPACFANPARAHCNNWAALKAGPKWPEVEVFHFSIFQKQILMHIFLMNFDSILMQFSMQNLSNDTICTNNSKVILVLLENFEYGNFTKVFRCVLTDVNFIIKFKPMEEFNFKK
jgi:hypothetical protein